MNSARPKNASVPLVDPKARLQRLCTGFGFTEGPVYLTDGTLIFSDIPGNSMWEWSAEVGARNFRKPSRHANGNTLAADDSIYTCEHSGRRVSRTDAFGAYSVVVDTFQGKRLNSPNDLVFDAQGRLWFTDPPYGTESDRHGVKGTLELDANYVFRFDLQAQKLSIATETLNRPNGLAFSTDWKILYVADSGASCGPHAPGGYDPSRPHEIVAFDVQPDGQLSGRRVLCIIEPGVPDGIRVDVHDNIWCAAQDGVHVLSPQGKEVLRIPVPERVANLTFGGEQGNELFICASQSVYRISTNSRSSH